MNRDLLIGKLSQALTQGESGIESAVKLLQLTLETAVWRDEFTSFKELVETPSPQGLGTTFERLWSLCDDNAPLLDLLDQAVMQRPGAPIKAARSPQATGTIRPTGTSQQAGLRRLRKDAPHLHEAVLAGRMSVNAALIEAGLRTKQITIFVDPVRAAEALQRAFTPAELEALMQHLKRLTSA